MLDERDRQEVRRVAKKHRSKAKSLNAASFPNKGETDFDGNEFPGLGRLKIADNAIGPDEADNQFLDTKHYTIIDGDRRLTPGVKYALGDALGALDVVQLGAGGAGHVIDPSLIPGIGLLSGTLDVANLGGGGAGHVIDNGLVPKIENLRGTLDYGALQGKPDLSRFLTSHDIQNRATHHWVEAYVTKHVKPSARR